MGSACVSCARTLTVAPPSEGPRRAKFETRDFPRFSAVLKLGGGVVRSRGAARFAARGGMSRRDSPPLFATPSIALTTPLLTPRPLSGRCGGKTCAFLINSCGKSRDDRTIRLLGRVRKSSHINAGRIYAS